MHFPVPPTVAVCASPHPKHSYPIGCEGSTGSGCNGGESLREQENKWTELGLNNITDLPSFMSQNSGQFRVHTLRNNQTNAGLGSN